MSADRPAARLLACLAFLAVALIGCSSGSGVGVSGTITFAGKPVPAGRIYFNPDFAKGNDGQQGYATIKDGKYDTNKDGQAAAGGPTLVTIQGYNGVAKPDNPDWIGDPLFEPYKTSIDLPKTFSTQDFEVPESAKKGAPGPARTERKL